MTSKPRLIKRAGTWCSCGPADVSPDYWPRLAAAVEWSRLMWLKENP